MLCEARRYNPWPLQVSTQANIASWPKVWKKHSFPFPIGVLVCTKQHVCMLKWEHTQNRMGLCLFPTTLSKPYCTYICFRHTLFQRRFRLVWLPSQEAATKTFLNHRFYLFFNKEHSKRSILVSIMSAPKTILPTTVFCYCQKREGSKTNDLVLPTSVHSWLLWTNLPFFEMLTGDAVISL